MEKQNVIARVIRVTEQTSGRDKLCRLVQYGSKFVYWFLEQESLNPELIPKLKSLESSISTARKLFRLGTSLTQFRGALQAINLNNPLLRFLVTLTKINRGIYLLLDHLIWAQRMNLVSIDAPYWSKLSNRFWIFAIFLALVRDIYEMLKALRVEKERLRQYQSYEPITKKALCNVVHNNPAIFVDVIKNSSDFFLPLTRLDLVYLPGGVVGLLGVVSSLAGLIATYNEQLKLKFS